jgi:DNA gyrase subunit A
MAGIRLAAGASAVWFGAVDPAAPSGAVVVTVAASDGALPGTGAGSVKVSDYGEFPAKGRATGGVRCHRLLKGEDALVVAWAGAAPALGATEAGVPVDLPGELGRRDGSGLPLLQPLAALGGTPAAFGGNSGAGRKG